MIPTEDLRNVLLYMKEIGFLGLNLTQNPFAVQPKKIARPSNPPAQAEPTAKRSAPAKVIPFEKSPNHSAPTTPKPPRPSLNLGSLLDLMGSESPSTTDKAKAVTGKDQTELLRNLYGAFCQCQACPLGTTRQHFVFGEGPPNSKLMFVGEGPGADEDILGRPFVGKAGQLLTKIIDAMGFNRADVFIANVVKCRPPNNRNPLPDEMSQCGPILEKQISIIQPKIIVVLGAVALGWFKGQKASIMRMRGEFFVWRDIWVMPTYHPAYVLRNPASKREVWSDMQQVMAKWKELHAGEA